MWKKRIKTAVSLVVSLWTLATVVGFFASLFAFSLPTCDSSSIVKSDLLSILNEIPLLKANDTKALYVNNVSEVSYDEEKQIRQCKAETKLSNTNVMPVVYTISEHDGEYFIEAELVGIDDLIDQAIDKELEEFNQSMDEFNQAIDEAIDEAFNTELEVCGNDLVYVIHQEALLLIKSGLQGEDLKNQIILMAQGIGERNDCDVTPVLDDIFGQLGL